MKKYLISLSLVITPLLVHSQNFPKFAALCKSENPSVPPFIYISMGDRTIYFARQDHQHNSSRSNSVDLESNKINSIMISPCCKTANSLSFDRQTGLLERSYFDDGKRRFISLDTLKCEKISDSLYNSELEKMRNHYNTEVSVKNSEEVAKNAEIAKKKSEEDRARNAPIKF